MCACVYDGFIAWLFTSRLSVAHLLARILYTDRQSQRSANWSHQASRLIWRILDGDADDEGLAVVAVFARFAARLPSSPTPPVPSVPLLNDPGSFLFAFDFSSLPFPFSFSFSFSFDAAFGVDVRRGGESEGVAAAAACPHVGRACAPPAPLEGAQHTA
jgi:hypothetical protein